MPKMVPFAGRRRRTPIEVPAAGGGIIKIGVDRDLRWSRAAKFKFAYRAAKILRPSLYRLIGNYMLAIILTVISHVIDCHIADRL